MMSDFDGKTPVLIAMRHPFTGAQRTQCDTCEEYVFDHAENIAAVKNAKGWVICEACAIKIKKEYPELLRADKQLWHGEMRETQPAPQWKWLDRLLKK